MYFTYYESPLGRMLLGGTEEGLSGLWISEQKYYAASMDEEMIQGDDLPLFEQTKEWLDRYFNKEQPDPKELKLAPKGTDFRKTVWDILLKIPYGQTTSYGAIAKSITESRKGSKTSARAVGGAVGHNPISIIIPCHRVVGSDGSLTGFASGLDKKVWLLQHEDVIL